MTRRLAQITCSLLLSGAALLLCAGLAFAAEAAVPEPEVKPEATPKADADKPTLKLRADSIVFNRAKGDLLLKGNVHVTRTVGENTLAVDCDEMSAKMNNGKMENVLATGNVTLVTADMHATAETAEFDFVENTITLRGNKEAGTDATMKTLKEPVIVSNGPTIIFHTETQNVEMPDGGVTEIQLDSLTAEEKPGKE